MARTRPKSLRRQLFTTRPPDIAGEDLNQKFADSLRKHSHHSNAPPGLKKIITELEGLKVSDEARQQFLRPLTIAEILESRTRLRNGKTYADFSAHIAFLMGPIALDIILKKFDQWTRNEGPPASVTTVAIATNKPASKEDILFYLHKSLRPIGISSLFRAWFQHNQQARISKIISATAQSTMHGFIPNREAHEMILQTLFRIENAKKKNKPLFGVKMDFSKCFDKISHLLIAACDAAVGVGNTFAEIANSFVKSEIKIRVSEEDPVGYKLSSGGPQGDARVPGIWAIISSTLAKRLEKKSSTMDPFLLITSALMFADDIILTAESVEDVKQLVDIVFEWAQETCMPVEIKEVAANDAAHSRIYHNPDLKFTHGKESFTVARSMRILGACLHFCVVSPCPLHKCPKCHDGDTRDRICDTCVEDCILKACSAPFTIVEKVAIANSTLYNALSYGVYTCPKQQDRLHKVLSDIRSRIQGPGYKSAAYLQASLGGYGMKDTAIELATTTAVLLDRILTRSTRTLEVIVNYSDNLKDPSWPGSLLRALQDVRPQLHPSLCESSHKSQTPVATISCTFASFDPPKNPHEETQIGVRCNAVVSFSSSGEEYFSARNIFPGSKFSEKQLEISKTIALAQILEAVSDRTHKILITLGPNDTVLAKLLNTATKQSKHPRFFESVHRNYYSIVARIALNSIEPCLGAQCTTVVGDISVVVDCSEVKLTPYPLIMTWYDLTVQPPADLFLRDFVSSMQLKTYCDTRQIASLLGETNMNENEFE